MDLRPQLCYYLGHMIGIVLALLAALCWGTSGLFARLGLRYLGPTAGTLVSLISSLAIVVLAALALEWQDLGRITLWTVAWFAIVGLLNFAMGRNFSFWGIQYAGVSRATPVQASSPLFAIILAVSFMGETMTLFSLLGTLTIIVGMVVVMSGQRS